MLAVITDVRSPSLLERLKEKSPKRVPVKRVIIVLDALDQLLPIETTIGLSWLLDYVPQRIRLVVSSLEGEYLEVMRRRGSEEITIPPLSDAERRQIVQILLDVWGRRLDDEQIAALLAHPETKPTLPPSGSGVTEALRKVR